MIFKKAYELPIGNYVEKKGNFSYLSWCYAVKFLRENYPDATWNIKENADGVPMFPCVNGFMVKCTVSLEFDYPMWLPILDNRNKPIIEPTSFDVNTAIMRCLTKAIGVATGIGLGLYAGEDLPTEREPTITGQQSLDIQALCSEVGGDVEKLLKFAGADTFETIPASKYDAVIKGLEAKRDNK